MWSFNGGRLPKNAYDIGFWPGNLVITNVSKNNQGVYECWGLLKYKYDGDHSRFMAGGFLRVTGNFQ